MNISVADESGKETKVEMGCYGIGMTRVIASTVEQCHDENGIIWPKNIAPFQVHLIGLGLEKNESLKQKAEELYSELKQQHIEVLFDDRDISAGKKFADSDLIGIPVRLTLSSRSLENGGVEWKLRGSDATEIVALEQLVKKIEEYLLVTENT